MPRQILLERPVPFRNHVFVLDLRLQNVLHTNAKTLLNAGRSVNDVQEILRHRDFRTTLPFAHLSKSHLVSVVTMQLTIGHIKWHKVSRTLNQNS